MEIYAYLKKDHRKVARLFKRIISSGKSKERQNLFIQLRQELELHTSPEHHTFYAAIRTSSENVEDVNHADKEHREITLYLKKLSKISPNETMWWVKLGELKNIVEHHIEYEESTLFSDAKNIISREESEELVTRMEELKEKLKQSAYFKSKYVDDQKRSKTRKK